MAELSTTYGPDSTTTRASGSVIPQVDPMQNPMVQFAYKVALARLARQQQQQAQMAAPQRAAAPEPVQHERPLPSATGSLADEMEARNRIIAADEASRPAPMRFLNSGPGITGGYVPDPSAMDANQRRIFLPQSSTMGAIEPVPSAGQDVRYDEARDLAMQRAKREAAAPASTGYAGPDWYGTGRSGYGAGGR